MTKIGAWDWEITRRCNLSCLHCLLGGLPSGQQDAAVAVASLEKMRSLGCLHLNITGGEPLIRSDIFQLVEMAARFGIAVSLITNGTYPEKVGAMVEKGLLAGIGVSIDGDASAHDGLRGKGSYAKAVESMRLATGAGVDCCAYMAVGSHNIECLARAVELLVEAGVSRVHVNEINVQGRCAANGIVGMHGDAGEKAARLFDRLGDVVSFEECEVDGSCTVGPESAYVAYDGLVYTCSELAICAPDMPIGRLLDGRFEELLDAYYAKLVRPAHCRYRQYRVPGICLCVNYSRECGLCRRGGDER